MNLHSEKGPWVEKMPDAQMPQRMGELASSGATFAVATVVAVDRSAPREAGAKMIVHPDGRIEGTVGGGTLEALTIKAAQEAIAEGKPRMVKINLDPKMGKSVGICGGVAEIFIEVYKRDFKILIIGAGHVGQKVAELAASLGYSHDVADDRADFANKERFPNASRVCTGKYPDFLHKSHVDRNTYIVIMTRNHSYDTQALIWAMRTPVAYIGVIGSRSKIGEVFALLAKKHNLHPARDLRVHGPIGLDIGGRTPAEIALSVMAEVMKVRFKASGRHMREAKGSIGHGR